LTYFGLDRLVERRSSGAGAGPALALGAFLDGIPEQMVLGIGLAAGEGVSVSLLAAIFVSNLPEAIGSATEMRAAGSRPATIRRLWIAVAVVCTLATVAGYAIADSTAATSRRPINGFAAGALLVMLIDSMIPEAPQGGRRRGPRDGPRLRRRHRPLGRPPLLAGLRAHHRRAGQEAHALVEVPDLDPAPIDEAVGVASWVMSTSTIWPRTWTRKRRRSQSSGRRG
jgi:hypothetical protein